MSRTHLRQTFLSEAEPLAGYLCGELKKDSYRYIDEIFHKEGRQNFVAAGRGCRR